MALNVLEVAGHIIECRRVGYDGPEQNFARIAKIWEVILETEVTPRDVALCMIGVKIAREVWQHDADNLIDAAGYAQCAQECYEGHEEARPMEEKGCATVGGEDCREAGAKRLDPSVRDRKARGHH